MVGVLVCNLNKNVFIQGGQSRLRGRLKMSLEKLSRRKFWNKHSKKQINEVEVQL